LLVVAHPEANPFQLIHIWRNQAFVVNQVEMTRNALDDYHTAHGRYPDDWPTAVRWWASKEAVPLNRIMSPRRGDLVYWSDEQYYLLAWQDPAVRPSYVTIAYTPDGTFLDPNSLALNLVGAGVDVE
jgi:hypothetical protein